MSNRASRASGPSVVRGARVRMSKRKFARAMRRRPTPSEKLAWQMLRNRGCLGLKFRRQQPIRGYIVDFYCAELRLALEIGGSVHWDEPGFILDFERDEHLEKHRVRVLHIRPQDVPHLPQILNWYLSPSPDRERGPGGGGHKEFAQQGPIALRCARSSSRRRFWGRALGLGHAPTAAV